MHKGGNVRLFGCAGAGHVQCFDLVAVDELAQEVCGTIGVAGVGQMQAGFAMGAGELKGAIGSAGGKRGQGKYNGGVCVADVPFGALKEVGARGLPQLVCWGDRARFGTAPERAPASVVHAARQRPVQRGTVCASLATGYNFDHTAHRNEVETTTRERGKERG